MKIIYRCEFCRYENEIQEHVRSHEMIHLRKTCKHEECTYYLKDDHVIRYCDLCGSNDAKHLSKVFEDK